MAVPFQFAQPDFSQLTKIGENFGAMRRDQRFNSVVQNAMKDGVFNYDAAINALQAGGFGKEALALATQKQEADALAGYRAEQLVPEDIRTLKMLGGGNNGSPQQPLPGYIADKFKSGAEKAQEAETVKAEVKAQSERGAKAEAAQAFLNKVKRLETLIKSGGDQNFVPTQDVPINPEANDLFGPYQGSATNRFVGSVLGTNAEKRRTRMQALLRDLELDVAKFKLSGTGPVTESERLIARETLPQTTNPDAQTALDIIEGLKQEANAVIGGGGAPTPRSVPTFNVTPQGAVTPTQANTGGFPTAPTMMPGAPPNPQSTGPIPVEPDPKKRVVGQVYVTPEGKQYLWAQDSGGNVGWEPLDAASQ